MSTPTQRTPSRLALPDRWHSRDYPVLLEIARALDSGVSPDEHMITTALAITSDQLDAAWHALREGEYVRVLKERPRRLGDGAMTPIGRGGLTNCPASLAAALRLVRSADQSRLVHDDLGHAVPDQVGEPLAYVDVGEGDALVQLDRLHAAAAVHVATIVEGATG
jgi:hypothetical protein